MRVRVRTALAALGFVATAAVTTNAAAIGGAATWKAIDAPTFPPASTDAMSSATGFDAATGQLVEYVVNLTDCNVLPATWTWDGATWSRMLSANEPPSMQDPTVVYDAATRQLLMFGGESTCGSARTLADTWSWNGVRWNKLHPLVSPPPTEGACAAYDVATGEVVMYGGRGGGTFVSDPNTWTWNGTTWSHHLVTPAPSTVAHACSMAYDATRQQVVFAAGDVGGPQGALDTWVWAGSSWSQAGTSGPSFSDSPPKIAYDADLDAVLLYGVQANCVRPPNFLFGDVPCNGTPTSETWMWSGAGWQRLFPGADAVPRHYGTIVFDDSTRQIVLAGGLSDDPNPAASWVYASGGPSSAAPQRLFGVDRETTAAAVSQAEFAARGSASAVVLARGDQFADALTGGPLAVAKKGPLLLTSSGSLDPNTSAEISRVLAPGGTVYLLGGTSALPAAVEQQVIALGFPVTRIAGSDRYGTAVAVAAALGNPTTVLEASGADFADALSAGPAAASTHAAILLTAGGLQSAATATYLAAHPGVRYAIGGPAANADSSATALVGSDRYATSAQVARAFFPAATSFGIATGTGFADALSGGELSAARNQPILLTSATNALPEPVSAFISTHAGTTTAVQVYGGTAAVSDAVVTSVSSALTGG